MFALRHCSRSTGECPPEPRLSAKSIAMSLLDTKQNPEIEEMEFIITNIPELGELPGKWAFEMLTTGWS
jgi:hypothetical protein